MADDRAQALLDAQVRFFMSRLSPAEFVPLLEEELDAWLAVASELRLSECVTREQITAVAVKYAVNMHIPGSIPELANEIADRIYSHPTQDSSLLGDVVAAKHVEAFTTKLLELPLIQDRLLESPLMVEIVSELLYRLATDAAAQNREFAQRIPGVGSLLGAGTALLSQVAGGASKDLEVRLQELSLHAARLVLSRTKGTVNAPEDPWIRDSVVEMYREQADKPIGSLRDYMTQEDLEDLLVLLYDCWLSLRETDYVRALITEGVDFFFDKYSDMTLLGLIEEFGVGRDDLVEEAQRFAPPIIELLRERGVLEAFLRRRLEPFFASEEARAVLSDPGE